MIKLPSFITVEGIEGAGKSTAVKHIADLFSEKKHPFLVTREPGGTPIAEKIRQILLHHETEELIPDTELLLMSASRAQHVAKVIKPALVQGKSIICDRFVDASFAYQGGGRGIVMSRISELMKWMLGDFQPDLTLLLDVPVEMGLDRLKQRGKLDRIESENINFFNHVRKIYLQRAEEFPERFRVIDAAKPLKNVQLAVQQVILNWFEKRKS